MYRVAYRLLADADRANDVVQEACVKALANIDGFNGRATLTTWLYRITVNCATDALRASARREDARELFASRSGGLGSAVWGSAGSAGSAVSPALLAETRELTDIAWTLLERLPDDCRSAFALTQLDGYSYDEVAEIESQPRGTIASRVFRAKRILLEQMNAHIDRRAES
jgi:RNA polymerase sigma-70 factor (ECF subfamily)